VIRLLIVDDHTVVRQGLSMLFGVDAGALGYLFKDAEPDALFAAVRTAYAHQ
jgi:DNA-binding NarL/FixJ family response regulator